MYLPQISNLGVAAFSGSDFQHAWASARALKIVICNGTWQSCDQQPGSNSVSIAESLFLAVQINPKAICPPSNLLEVANQCGG